MPASVDTTQQGIVDVGEGNQVTVSLPHVEVNITKKKIILTKQGVFTFVFQTKSSMSSDCVHRIWKSDASKLMTNFRIVKLFNYEWTSW